MEGAVTGGGSSDSRGGGCGGEYNDAVLVGVEQ